MKQTLANALRPKSLSRLIGQDSIIRSIEKQFASRAPRAIILSGQPGSGKTTIARVLSIGVQCRHQDGVGEPCLNCRKRKFDFSIHEVNAAKVNGKDEISDLASSADFAPMYGRKRVFILDEAHQLTSASQNLLLKPTEDAPKKTLWIFNTTEPRKLLPALRRRCIHYILKPLSYKAIDKFVMRAVKLAGYDEADMDEFIEEINKAQITAPGVILEALEKYLNGLGAKESVGQIGSTNVDTYRVCKAVVSGDMQRLMAELKRATQDDVRLIRAAVIGYLNGIIMRSNTKELWCTYGIKALAETTWVDESIQMPYINAILIQMAFESPRRRR